MKTIGLIGGMSWESTVPYYQVINRAVAARLGGLHSAKIVLYSVDFAEVALMQSAGRWEQAGALMADAAESLERAGADMVLIGANTMHKVAAAVEARVRIPLLHIVDPTAEAIRAAGHTTIGLLGTRFTMEQDFCKARFADKHGLKVLVPPAESRDALHRIIYEELCRGVIREESRQASEGITRDLLEAGAQCVVLGCTELGLILKDGCVPAPLFDTMLLHAQAAVNAALRD
ncbi:MAG: aspartate racemase [Betaproteobacteria bacterium]|nr:aspartate racemase [Betaproteobacteria bacterium]